MTIATGLVAFIIIWWLVLFTVLPWGVQQNSSPAVGEDHGAPLRHRIGMKAAVTTAISVIVWAALFAVIELNVLSFREIAGGY